MSKNTEVTASQEENTLLETAAKRLGMTVEQFIEYVAKERIANVSKSTTGRGRAIYPAKYH